MQYILVGEKNEANLAIYHKSSAGQQPIIARLRRLISLLLVIAPIVFVSACATQSPVVSSSNIQSALVQTGFKSKPVTTAQQRRRLQSLPEHEFTQVKQNGETFYVWADKPNDRLYCGSDQAYRDYKELRKVQRDRESGAITWIDEPREGNPVPVTVFYGWAPFREW